MAFDFPNPPMTVGTLYDTGTGVVYAWDGVAWVVSSMSRLTARRGNRVVNGNMAISQENGTTAVSTSGAYPADQWLMSVAGLSITSGQSSGWLSPNGSRTAIYQQATVLKASLAASDYAIMYQKIEGLNVADLCWGTASAIPAVARFNARADTPGLYTLVVRNDAATYSFLKGLNITTAFQTFVVPIPAQTAGVWSIDNTSSTQIMFTTAAGATLTAAAEGWNSGQFFAVPGQINNAAVISKNLVTTDVGLYADPDNTGLPPPWEVPDYATELVRCQRYFSNGNSFLVGSSGANGQIVYTDFPHKTVMRAAPSVTTAAPTYSNASAMSSNGATTNMARLQITIAAAGYGYAFGSGLTLNARM